MDQDKKKIVTALKKAHTSIGKILDTVEKEGQENTCFDVIQQNLAAIGLLKSANLLMLERHIDTFIATKKKMSKRDAQELKEEVLRIVAAAQRK